MERFLAVLSLVVFLLVGCQDSSSIVAPDNSTTTTLDKKADSDDRNEASESEEPEVETADQPVFPRP